MITLGETSLRIGDWAKLVPTMVDQNGTEYRPVSKAYYALLLDDARFDSVNMRAFDFKLRQASGLVWPEAPTGELVFKHPDIDEVLATATAHYVHLDTVRKRSTGVIYVDEWEWKHNLFIDETLNL